MDRKQYMLNYNKLNKNTIKEKRKLYNQKNKNYIVESSKKYNKKYYELNKEKLQKQMREYGNINKEHIKNYKKINKEKIKNKRKEWEKYKKQTDPLFKAKGDIRCLINSSFRKKGFKKSYKTEQILCIPIPKFIAYIESQFYDHPITGEKMTWENHTLKGWHIDHKIPIDFAKTVEKLVELNHYSNLQPMWCEKNWKKGKKLVF